MQTGGSRVQSLLRRRARRALPAERGFSASSGVAGEGLGASGKGASRCPAYEVEHMRRSLPLLRMPGGQSPAVPMGGPKPGLRPVSRASARPRGVPMGGVLLSRGCARSRKLCVQSSFRKRRSTAETVYQNGQRAARRHQAAPSLSEPTCLPARKAPQPCEPMRGTFSVCWLLRSARNSWTSVCAPPAGGCLELRHRGLQEVLRKLVSEVRESLCELVVGRVCGQPPLLLTVRSDLPHCGEILGSGGRQLALQ